MLRRPGAALNIQHLVAWDAITSHLLFVLGLPAAPVPIRLQAACTLDDILPIAPCHLISALSDLQATVQRRVLDILAQKIMPCGLASSASMDLCRLRLKTTFCKHQVTPYSLGGNMLVPARPFRACFVINSFLWPRVPDKRLFGANQYLFSMHNAYVRGSRRLCPKRLCVSTLG